MQMTVTNLLAVTINTPVTGGNGVSPDAVGGSVFKALPYPFNASGPLAAGASRTLPVQSADFQHKSVPWLPLTPSNEWQALVQAGVVSVTFLADANSVADEAVHTA